MAVDEHSGPPHPSALIQASIEQLEALSAFLADDVLAARCEPARLPPEKRLSKEALLTISVLLPKLRAARRVHGEAVAGMRVCESCED
jgi:hypothetical protein